MDGFYTTVGIVGIAMMIRMGPVDAGRTLYNQATGDMQVLKTQLTEYCMEGIAKKHGVDKDSHIVYKTLRQELGLKSIRDTEQDVSIEVLWAAAERYPKSDIDYWLWTDVGEQNIAPKLEKLEKWISSCCSEKDINKDKK